MHAHRWRSERSWWPTAGAWSGRSPARCWPAPYRRQTSSGPSALRFQFSVGTTPRVSPATSIISRSPKPSRCGDLRHLLRPDALAHLIEPGVAGLDERSPPYPSRPWPSRFQQKKVCGPTSVLPEQANQFARTDARLQRRQHGHHLVGRTGRIVLGGGHLFTNGLCSSLISSFQTELDDAAGEDGLIKGRVRRHGEDFAGIDLHHDRRARADPSRSRRLACSASPLLRVGLQDPDRWSSGSPDPGSAARVTPRAVPDPEALISMIRRPGAPAQRLLHGALDALAANLAFGLRSMRSLSPSKS